MMYGYRNLANQLFVSLDSPLSQAQEAPRSPPPPITPTSLLTPPPSNSSSTSQATPILDDFMNYDFSDQDCFPCAEDIVSTRSVDRQRGSVPETERAKEW
jgi:hypothetical protein